MKLDSLVTKAKTGVVLVTSFWASVIQFAWWVLPVWKTHQGMDRVCVCSVCLSGPCSSVASSFIRTWLSTKESHVGFVYCLWVVWWIHMFGLSGIKCAMLLWLRILWPSLSADRHLSSAFYSFGSAGFCASGCHQSFASQLGKNSIETFLRSICINRCNP